MRLQLLRELLARTPPQTCHPRDLCGGILRPQVRSRAGAGAGPSWDGARAWVDEQFTPSPSLTFSTALATSLNSGQKAILAFLNSIFEDAGADPTIGSIGYGLAQIIISILGIRYLVPRFGRIQLLTTSLAGNSVSMALLGFSFFASNQMGINSLKSWLPIVALISFISFTAVGLGPLAWAYSSEICPKAIRSLVSGGALFSFWLLSFLG